MSGEASALLGRLHPAGDVGVLLLGNPQRDEADPAIAQAREAEKNNAQNRNKSRPKTKPAKPQGNIKLNSKPAEQKARPQAADKPIDPDSPFAKLQALKERMQKSA